MEMIARTMKSHALRHCHVEVMFHCDGGPEIDTRMAKSCAEYFGDLLPESFVVRTIRFILADEKTVMEKFIVLETNGSEMKFWFDLNE
jgi:hypothetical protein